MDNQEYRNKRMLCFPCGENIYGVSFAYVEETFRAGKITKIPCLNDVIIGLCNQKGVILPVISMGKLCGQPVPEESIGCCMMKIVQDEYCFLLQVDTIPFILETEDINKIEEYKGGNPILKIKQIYQIPPYTVFSIDIETMVKKLIGTLQGLK